MVLRNTLLVLGSILVTTIMAEAAVRVIDGYRFLAFPLDGTAEPTEVPAQWLDKVALAPGVDRAWFAEDPPPLPNRKPIPEDWFRLFRQIESNPPGDGSFRAIDAFRAWNAKYAGDPCQNRVLRHAPGQLYFYDPVDGSALPPYRFPPNAALPNLLITNQLGWRGAPIEVPRQPRTVRIVFVGSSVAMDAPHLPFGFTERAGYWLNRWAASKKLDLRFEVLNAGRESIGSPEIAAIVATEVLPVRPDLVVYHEGGNQFRLESIVEKMPAGEVARPPQPQASIPNWLQTAARYSALATRVSTALRIAGIEAANAAASGTNTANSGAEWPKPDYRINWPAGLDEADPDLAYPNLPVSLSIIQRDLDRIRRDLDGIGAQLTMTSFIWMAKDGLVLDPVRHRYIIDQLNISNYPFRYRDVERLAAFQNRVLAKYARTHGLPFIDFARDMPLEPDLFIDAVHTNKAGSRLKGWVAFNQLVPIIEKHLAASDWPKAPHSPAPALPTFTPRQVSVSCH